MTDEKRRAEGSEAVKRAFFEGYIAAAPNFSTDAESAAYWAAQIWPSSQAYADANARQAGAVAEGLDAGGKEAARLAFKRTLPWFDARNMHAVDAALEAYLAAAPAAPVGVVTEQSETQRRLKDIRSHIEQSIVRELAEVTLKTTDALWMHSLAALARNTISAALTLSPSTAGRKPEETGLDKANQGNDTQT